MLLVGAGRGWALSKTGFSCGTTTFSIRPHLDVSGEWELWNAGCLFLFICVCVCPTDVIILLGIIVKEKEEDGGGGGRVVGVRGKRDSREIWLTRRKSSPIIIICIITVYRYNIRIQLWLRTTAHLCVIKSRRRPGTGWRSCFVFSLSKIRLCAIIIINNIIIECGLDGLSGIGSVGTLWRVSVNRRGPDDLSGGGSRVVYGSRSPLTRSRFFSGGHRPGIRVYHIITTAWQQHHRRNRCYYYDCGVHYDYRLDRTDARGPARCKRRVSSSSSRRRDSFAESPRRACEPFISMFRTLSLLLSLIYFSTYTWN